MHEKLEGMNDACVSSQPACKSPAFLWEAPDGSQSLILNPYFKDTWDKNFYLFPTLSPLLVSLPLWLMRLLLSRLRYRSFTWPDSSTTVSLLYDKASSLGIFED